MNQNMAFVDQLLSNVSNGYFLRGLISEMLLPMIPVDMYSGDVGAYGTQHLKLENAMAGGTGKYRSVDPVIRSKQKYDIGSFGLETTVTQRDYSNFTEPFNADRDATIGLTSLIMIGKEKALADTLSNKSIITNNVTLSGQDQFDDYTNSDPIDVINTAFDAIIDATGAKPTFMAMDIKVARVLRYNPKILDNLGFKYNRPGGLTNEDLAKAFEVEKIYVAEGRYDTAKSGQTPSLGPIWGKNIILGVAPESAGKYQVSLGYRLQKSGQERRVYKYAVNNPPESTNILVDDEYQHFIANGLAGYLIENAIS